ncbi:MULTISPECIES: AbrB/MazE/SpoVT family DNA-binding domain-containing protein [Bacillota]|uniref:AbrB/MazE/SpoVT family DNA-binding domain-containing protein n=1 Tax=Bacillota TaxID=1239 RepID=UPI00242FD588|nr:MULTISPECIES: AbrB/MazE/SpoVT family DNA-binding domain-containing protein [Bacillota]
MERTVELKRWGNSLSVRIPKSILDKADINELPVKFEISVNRNKDIVLKKYKDNKSLKDIFKNFDYEKYWSDWEKENPNKSKELDSGDLIGREIF